MKAKAKPKRNRGQQPHVPTVQTEATVKAMAGIGYSQGVIARHIGVSEPPLRAHYRQLLDNACEHMCALVLANLVKTATTKNDNAGVQAAKFILSCRAGWKETTAVEVQQTSRGITGVIEIVRAAKEAELEELAALEAEEAANHPIH